MRFSVPCGLLGLAWAAAGVAYGQGTGFSYQGRLSEGNRPANGTYDFRVSLFGVATAGSSVAGPLSFPGTGVTNGLFTLVLDFGAGAFSSAPRWIEVSVRTNGSAAFTALTPRRPILATPQAVFAATAGTALSVPATALSGVISSANLPPASTDGSGLIHLNASQLTSGTVPDGRLAASVARVAGVETLLAGTSNALAGFTLTSSNVLSGAILGSSNTLNDRIYGTQANLQAQVNTLSARLDAFLAASYPANGLVAPSLPSGLTVVSPVSADVALLSQGLVQFSRIDAPVWSTGATLNAPGVRQAHGAVWTGSSMMVWGGLNGTTPLNTGGIYDAGNDVWTSIATVNAPAARRGHALAWTGSRLLVWGGQSDTFLDSGGQYAPNNQTWTATTTQGAPSARTEHAFAWTTARLFV